MTLERKRRVFALLRDLVDVPIDQQAHWIQTHADDAAMANELLELLQSSATADSLDDGAAGWINQMAAGSDDDLAAGGLVGDWRVLRTLGRGGMGVVYLVEREGEDYRQQGALKLIKRGMDSAEIVASFRRERRILSQLDHPNIARLLDGGVAEDGRPWLVMEHVDGETLLAWAARNNADLDARVGLFLQICAAVASAHRQLVVHRDIKPSNILVDKAGNTRLLDFGIAKVLEDEAHSERTATASRFLSRAYAAPEQVSNAPVSTVTDVYQLGLLLAELLSGCGPAALNELAATRATQRLSSARLRAGSEGPARISARQLHGDAGIIISRACDADPTRRYVSVEALADDVARWRGGHPIIARPDSRLYRLRRFVGRHQLGTLLASVALIALLTATVVALRQAQRAEREAERALSVQTFLTGIFDAAAPDASSGRRVTARELLDRGSERIRGEFSEQPELRANLLLTLGSLYRQLGQFDEAASLLKESRATIDNGDDAAMDRIDLELSIAERERGKLDEASSLLDRLLAKTATQPASRATLHAERATLRERQGRFQEALVDAQAALAIDEMRGAEGLADRVRDRQIEGLVLTRLGKLNEARTAFDRAIEGAVAVYGDDDTRVALLRNDYGALLLNKGLLNEGEKLVLQALKSRRSRLDADHPSVAESLQVLGAAQRLQGRYDEAELSYQEALDIQRRSLGENHADIAVGLNSMGILALMRQRFDVANDNFAQAIAINNRNGQGQTPSTATMQSNRGLALMRMGRYDEAQTSFEAAIAVQRAALGNDHPALMSALNGLAQLQTRQGRLVDAERNVREGLRIAAATIGPGRDQAGVRNTLATVLLRGGKPEQALNEASDALAMFDGAGSTPDPRRYASVAIQADALLRLGKLKEASTLAAEVLQARQARSAIEPHSLIAAYALRARVARADKDSRAAHLAQREGRQLFAKLSTPDPELALELDR